MPPIKITPTLATDILSNLNLLQILQSPRNSFYLFDFLYGIDISSAIWRPNVDAVLKRQAHQCGVDREKDVMRKSLKIPLHEIHHAPCYSYCSIPLRTRSYCVLVYDTKGFCRHDLGE